MKQYRHYLYGQKFTIRTDHGALRWLTNFKDPQGQVARWLEVLGAYDYEIRHRPRLRHGNADSMSRGPCQQCGREDDGGRPEGDVAYSCQVVTRSQSRKKPEEEGTTNWLQSEEWNREKLETAQAEDPDIGWILESKKKNVKPEWREVVRRGAESKTYWRQWGVCVPIGPMVSEISCSQTV